MTILSPAAGDRFIPKPRLALNIGITGHRLNKLAPAAMETVPRQFRAMADDLSSALSNLATEAGGVFADMPPLVRVVTGLAEGSDRIAISSAPAGWVYEAVLPMARAEYARDFGAEGGDGSSTVFDGLLAGAASVTELPAPGAATDEDARTASYHRLGTFLVRQVDILVAVWDGAPAEGPGGTGDVVAHALDAHKPVIWIVPTPGADIRRLIALGSSVETHRFETLDAAAVAVLMRGLLLPPAAAPRDAHHHAPVASPEPTGPAPVAAAPTYFRTPWPLTLYIPFAYMMLRRMAKAGRWAWPLRYPNFNQQLGSWDAFFAAMPTAGAAPAQQTVRTILFPRSIWADTLGWYFGNVYRSAYVSSFLLASLSVPLGLCYLFFLWSPAVLDIKAAFVVIELLIITTVVVVVRRGSRSDWHGLWLQTRELSELLRLGRPLAYIGGLRDFVPPPASGESASFASWYARATFREVGLPNAALTSDYLKKVVAGTLATEISEQRAYHAANAGNLRRVHHVLHASGNFCFTATIVFLLAYLAAWGLDWGLVTSQAHAEEAVAHGEHAHSLFHEILEFGIKPVVSIAAAGLPALGAALTGIREQGDFEGFAERSTTTEQELRICEAHLNMLASRATVTVEAATESLTQAMLVMAKDVTAWKRQYAGKRLALPA